MIWVLIVVLALVALVLLLREPVGRWRRPASGARAGAQAGGPAPAAARQAERSRERAMNPAKAAARSGPPRWQQVAERQGGKCWLCGTRTYADDRTRVGTGAERLGATYPTVDYVLPIEQGGTYERDNVRLAHQHCRDLRRANPARREYGSPRRTYPPP